VDGHLSQFDRDVEGDMHRIQVWLDGRDKKRSRVVVKSAEGKKKKKKN
jgi:hypothetical protein